jgi:tRNA G46 methylase TrmB
MRQYSATNQRPFVTHSPNDPPANSRAIVSNQQGIHQSLDAVVKRHLNTRFRRPFPDHSLRTFDQAAERVTHHRGPLILDSFCGIGESTRFLAAQFPNALVIGIDKSRHRLNKHENQYPSEVSDNYLLLQADVEDFWRLAVSTGWSLSRHYLLYPNPWPKSAHLKRRVHGSPLFSSLLALGGDIEVRSNWATYIEEFSAALSIAGYTSNIQTLTEAEPITPFERKYKESGHLLWSCTAKLP